MTANALLARRDVFKRNAIEADRLAAAQHTEEEAKARRAARLEELMRAFEGDVTAVVQNLSGAAPQMQQPAGMLTGTADETNRQSTTVASAAEQASTNVQGAAHGTQQVTSNIVGVTRAAGEVRSVANHLGTESARLRQEVENFLSGVKAA